MIAYRFGIILSFLSVLCVCDNNVPSSVADAKYGGLNTELDCPNIGEECYECKKEHESCYSCCGREYLQCHRNICTRCTDATGDYVCGATPYETASQITLSITMAVGIIILIVVLWKMCVTPKHLRYSRRARARMIANDSTTPRSEDVTRSSISSIQIRIVARLQNRPPRYESSYNYNQRVEAVKQQATIDEAPPAYDAELEENVDKGPPPPYTIDLEASGRQGIDNNSFVADESLSGNANTTNARTATNASLITENTAGNSGRVVINCETVHI